MKTYSRRNRRPINRGSGDLSGIGSTGTKTTELKRSPAGSPVIQRSVRSISTPSEGVSPAASTTAGSFRSRIEHQSQPQEQELEKANAIARELRRSSLSSVPVCSLGKSPVMSPAATTAASVTISRGSGEGSCGGGSRGRVFGEDRGDDFFAGGSTALGGRRLWGGGGGGSGEVSLGAGRKRRLQQQGSAGKKRSAGAKTTVATRVGKEQTFLDFGQRSFGQRILCPRCDMLYVCGAAEDEARHVSLCAKTARGVEFAGWKQERVKARFADDGGRVLEIRNSDPAAHLAKLRDVERLMDADMGFAPGAREEAFIGSSFGKSGVASGGGGDARGGKETAFVTPPTTKKIATTTFLYVRKKRVLGCVVAQRIKSARRVLVEDVRGIRRERLRANVATGGHGASPEVERKKKAPKASKAASTSSAAVTSTPSPVNRLAAFSARASDTAHVVRSGCPPESVGEIVRGSALAQEALVPTGLSALPRREDSLWQDLQRNPTKVAATDAAADDRIGGASAEDGAGRKTNTAYQNIGTPPVQQQARRVIPNVAKESPRFFPLCEGEVSLRGGVDVIRRNLSIGEAGGQDLRAWTAGADLLPPCRKEGTADENREVYCAARPADVVPSPPSGVVAVCASETDNLSTLPALSSPPSGSCDGGILQRGGGGFDGEGGGGGGEAVHGYGGLEGAVSRTVAAAVGLAGGREGGRLEKGDGGSSSGDNRCAECERGTLNDSTNIGQRGVAPAVAAAAMELKRSRELERDNGGDSCDGGTAAVGAGLTPLRSWSMDSSSSSEASPPPPSVINGKISPKLPSKPSSLPPMPPSELVCEDEDTPTVVGTLQIWVHERSRRQGVATRLVDTVREKMVYGVPLRRDQIAFSQPTRDGYSFAMKYTNARLLIY